MRRSLSERSGRTSRMGFLSVRFASPFGAIRVLSRLELLLAHPRLAKPTTQKREYRSRPAAPATSRIFSFFFSPSTLPCVPTLFPRARQPARPVASTGRAELPGLAAWHFWIRKALCQGLLGPSGGFFWAFVSPARRRLLTAGTAAPCVKFLCRHLLFFF